MTQFFTYNPITFQYEGNYFAPEKTIEASTEVKPDNEFCIWDGKQWNDGRTQNEILSMMIAEETIKQLKRKNDGVDAIAQLSGEYKVMVQLGYVTEEENKASTELLIPVSNFILLGEWKFALDKLNEIGIETIGANLFYKLEAILTGYIAENY